MSLALALSLPALTAFATPIDDGAPFPVKAKSPAIAAPLGGLPGEKASDPAKPALATPSLSDRALGFMAGANRLLNPSTTSSEPPIAVPGAQDPDGGKVGTMLQKALALLGTPYHWGGTDPDKGFDCSGLVGYVFRNALGIELPRVSRDMARNGELVSDRAKLAAGDLVFFGRKGRVNHVGIYLGDGRFVHAPSRGKDVTVSSLDQGYWRGRFLQARRVSLGDI